LGILLWLFKENRISKIGVLAACLALLLGAMEIYGRAVELLAQPVSSLDVFRTSWVNVALAPEIAFCTGFAAIVLSIKANQLFPKNKILRATVRLLGLVTYPFYLLHQRVDAYVISQAKRSGLAPILCALIAFLCTGAIAMLIARYCEPALRKLLRGNLRALRPVRKTPVG
jgi:peptidoglycan/LPS O-acetylase OafA/YrhL